MLFDNHTLLVIWNRIQIYQNFLKKEHIKNFWSYNEEFEDKKNDCFGGNLEIAFVEDEMHY